MRGPGPVKLGGLPTKTCTNVHVGPYQWRADWLVGLLGGGEAPSGCSGTGAGGPCEARGASHKDVHQNPHCVYYSIYLEIKLCHTKHP